MSVLFVCLCAMHMQGPERPEEGIGSLALSYNGLCITPWVLGITLRSSGREATLVTLRPQTNLVFLDLAHFYFSSFCLCAPCILLRLLIFFSSLTPLPQGLLSNFSTCTHTSIKPT